MMVCSSLSSWLVVFSPQMYYCHNVFYCDLKGRQINFTISKTLVDVATDRDARYL